MNTLILGAAGFIGTHLARALSSQAGAGLTLFDRPGADFGPALAMAKGPVALHRGDFAGECCWDELLAGQQVVYHLISTIVPTNSNCEIAQTFHANVVATIHLLEACVRQGVKRVVFLSSGGTVYGMAHAMPLPEDTPTHPITAYGIQKVTIEQLLYLYRHMHGLDYRVIRLSNPYGPYQRPDGVQGVVTTFTHKALTGQPIAVYGDGSVVRDFIYIDDAVRGILRIAGHSGSEHTFNLGSGQGHSVLEVIATVERALGVKAQVVWQPGRSVDVPINILDIGRYVRHFGAFDAMPLAQGVQKTAAFMREAYGL